MTKASICLNMIVKNEAPVIGRCLASARSLVDRWCIVDTGSTDGTQELVRQAMEGVPGVLHERPWKNFGFNRNEALELAREQGCDYLLMIDADEVFQSPKGFAWPGLGSDAYELTCHYAGTAYARCALVATRLPWRWEGVLHEYLACEGPHRIEALAAPTIFVRHDGARARDPQTYLRDVALLEEALVEDPGNTRHVFYLAQSLRDAGRLDEARDTYLRRAVMGGWDEEVWFSLFQAAVLRERLHEPLADVQTAYLTAYEARPTRAEPLVELARYLRERGRHAQAALYAQAAGAMPLPEDRLFVDRATYEWRALDELSVSAFYARSNHWWQAGQKASLQLQGNMQALPTDVQPRVKANADFYRNDQRPTPV